MSQQRGRTSLLLALRRDLGVGYLSGGWALLVCLHQVADTLAEIWPPFTRLTVFERGRGIPSSETRCIITGS